MTERIRLAALLMIGVALAVWLTACNTIEGAGQDLSAAGQTMADWASRSNPEN